MSADNEIHGRPPLHVAGRQAVIDAARDLVGYVEGSGVANLDAALEAVATAIDHWRNMTGRPLLSPEVVAALRGPSGPSPALSWPVPELRAWLASLPDTGVVTIRRSSITVS